MKKYHYKTTKGILPEEFAFDTGDIDYVPLSSIDGLCDIC